MWIKIYKISSCKRLIQQPSSSHIMLRSSREESSFSVKVTGIPMMKRSRLENLAYYSLLRWMLFILKKNLQIIHFFVGCYSLWSKMSISLMALTKTLLPKHIVHFFVGWYYFIKSLHIIRLFVDVIILIKTPLAKARKGFIIHFAKSCRGLEKFWTR